WDRSTYFEFDNNPVRAIEFTATRVVDHPFKKIEPEKYKLDPDQIVLSFNVKHASTLLGCLNCQEHQPPVMILEKSDQPGNVSREFQYARIERRPEALLNRSLEMHENRRVWLPPARHHGAPHLLQGVSGEQSLVWMSRSSIHDTGSCIIVANASQIFTY